MRTENWPREIERVKVRTAVDQSSVLRICDALVKTASEIESTAIGSSRIAAYQMLAKDIRNQVASLHRLLGLPR